MLLSEALIAEQLSVGHGRLPTFQAQLLLALWRRNGGGRRGERPDITDLAGALGVNRATVYRGLAALRKKGWLVEWRENVRQRRVTIELRQVRRIELQIPPALAALADAAERKRA